MGQEWSDHMAHELHIQDGKASMMYVGDEPWHGLGTKLNKPATAEEAIQAANLDWEVVKRPLYAIGNGCLYPIKDNVAILRGGNPGEPDGPVFGVLGKDYTPLQNREAFAFFDSIVGQGAAIYHTAGALGKGERVWMLAKLPGTIQVVGDDVADKYLLLSNSHDGSSSVQVKFTPIRVVCQNTLTMALNRGRTIRIRHAPDVHQRLQQATELLGIVTETFSGIEKSFQAFARLQMDTKRLDEYLKLVFPDSPGMSSDSEAASSAGRAAASSLAEQRRQVAMERVLTHRRWSRYFFEKGKGMDLPGTRGTLWAAYNGVTEYIDHKQTGLNGERRLASIWFGNGYQAKVRAFRVATSFLAPGAGRG